MHCNETLITLLSVWRAVTVSVTFLFFITDHPWLLGGAGAWTSGSQHLDTRHHAASQQLFGQDVDHTVSFCHAMDLLEKVKRVIIGRNRMT